MSEENHQSVDRTVFWLRYLGYGLFMAHLVGLFFSPKLIEPIVKIVTFLVWSPLAIAWCYRSIKQSKIKGAIDTPNIFGKQSADRDTDPTLFRLYQGTYWTAAIALSVISCIEMFNLVHDK